MNAHISVIVSSADPVAAAALTELVREAGFACVEKSTSSPCIILADADAPLPVAEGLPVLFLAKTPTTQSALAKPVRRSELLSRLSQLAGSAALPASLKLNDDWVLHVPERLLKQQGESNPIVLTEKEVRLLACLLGSKEKSATRQKLLEDVWGYGSDINTHTLETHIHRLRAKLKDISESLISASEDGYRIAL